MVLKVAVNYFRHARGSVKEAVPAARCGREPGHSTRAELKVAGSTTCSRGSGTSRSSTRDSSPCAVGRRVGVHVQPLQLKCGVTRVAVQAVFYTLIELFNFHLLKY